METKQQEKVQTVSGVSGFWLLIVIAVAFASGYMFAKSVIISPAGFMSAANVQIGGAAVALVLLAAAFGLSGRLVKVGRKRS